MSKDSKLAIRSHAEERQWLIDLGEGNIIKGVRTLIQYGQREPTGRNGSPKNQSQQPKK
ncbi:MAG: hypothetical protein AB1801_19265 [Chloroflexota bacterium]